ncbi:MAG: hypothetical protein AAFR71_09470 [Pseudomonadota bacterium]
MDDEYRILAFAQRMMCDGADVLLAIVTSSREENTLVGTLSAFSRTGEHLGRFSPNLFSSDMIDAVFETGEPRQCDVYGYRILLMRVG